MRISFAMSQESRIREINGKQQEMDRLSTMIASGKKLLSPSDDPHAWASAMDLKQGLRSIETYEKNIQFGLSWGEMTDLQLGRLSDLIGQAKDIAVAAVNNAVPEEHSAQVEGMEQIVKDGLEVANATLDARYLFSGLEDPTPDKPFQLDDATGLVIYNGDDGSLKLRTGKGVNNESVVNLNGQEVFKPGDATGDILRELWSLREAVKANDMDATRAAISSLQGSLEHVRSQRSVLAVRLSDLERRQEALGAMRLNRQERLSHLEAADTAEMIVRLQQKQTAFEASLRVTAMVDDLNLLDFL